MSIVDIVTGCAKFEWRLKNILNTTNYQAGSFPQLLKRIGKSVLNNCVYCNGRSISDFSFLCTYKVSKDNSNEILLFKEVAILFHQAVVMKLCKVE